MPPKGYETVTLPNDLVQRIDEHADSIGVGTRTAALRNLLAEYKRNQSADSHSSSDNRDVLNRLDDLETHIDGRFDEVSRR